MSTVDSFEDEVTLEKRMLQEKRRQTVRAPTMRLNGNKKLQIITAND